MDREEQKAYRKARKKRQAWGLPWYREFDGHWYITIQGVRHKLTTESSKYKDKDGKEKHDKEKHRQAALDEWHKLMALAKAPEAKDANPVWVIFEKFLDYIEAEHSDSFYRYKRVCQSFKDQFPDLRVEDLKPKHLKEWFAAHPTWSESSHGYFTSVILAALNWAARPEDDREPLIEKNPLSKMRRPKPHSRGKEAVIDSEVLDRLIANAGWLQDALIFLRQTGTRPNNLHRIEAKYLDAEKRCIRLEQHKTAEKTRKPLVIPLTQAALAVVLRLAEQYPDGPLFRTPKNNPLTGELLTQAFGQLKKRLGIEGPILYGLRHSLATELITKDLPEAKIAFILGHKDTRMLHHHYSHLDSASKRIAEELDRTINGDGAGPAAPAP
ncbi:MAG TPA: tyrosine-type recombinase/integrase [Gemmataceae bacterium]|nr:tyrosine-type recombinase/integrase [Gemmataceae bacterium]